MQVRFGRICLFLPWVIEGVPQLLKQNPMDLQVVSNMFSHVYPYLGKVSQFVIRVGPIVFELGWNHRGRTHIRSSIQKKHRHSSKKMGFVCFLALQHIHEHVFYNLRYRYMIYRYQPRCVGNGNSFKLWRQQTKSPFNMVYIFSKEILCIC